MNIALRHPRTWPLWDVFFPPLCAVCEEPLEENALLFCTRCWTNAPLADINDLHKLHHVDRVAVGFRFGGADVVRESVHALKYEGVKPLAKTMAQKLLPKLPLKFLDAQVVWTEVPLHWRRHMTRGFNQSRALACELAKISGHDLPVTLLRRTRHTPTQTARSYRARSANVKNAFALQRGVSVPKAVLLIDDVITTGATVDECARTLKEAGAEWVGALSFALTHQS